MVQAEQGITPSLSEQQMAAMISNRLPTSTWGSLRATMLKPHIVDHLPTNSIDTLSRRAIHAARGEDAITLFNRYEGLKTNEGFAPISPAACVFDGHREDSRRITVEQYRIR